MRPTFIPRLVNEPFQDPGLFVPLTFRRRAFLFDLGDINVLSPKDILKITHVFVTHTHMDHFIGFDQLLRLQLGRGKSLHLFGPKGFLKNVIGKLQAYTWNLVHNYSEGLNIKATEIGPEEHVTQSFNCIDGFDPTSPIIKTANGSFVYGEPEFSIQGTILNHQVPCLAFSLKERFHINILKPRLEQLGLEVGPWVSQFKKLLYEKADPNTQIQIQRIDATQNEITITVGELANHIARITPGQKIAYVADTAYNSANNQKIIDLVRQADHLYIEAAFLEKESNIAKHKYHLTAHQAGTLARRAKVRAFSIFHHSPRYINQAHLLQTEAMQAFEGRKYRP